MKPSAALIVQENGEIGVFQMPVEPVHVNLCRVQCGQWLCECQVYLDRLREYQSALKQASENPIKCKDQWQAKTMIWHFSNGKSESVSFPKPGVYPIPNLTFEVEHTFHPPYSNPSNQVATISLTTEPEKEGEEQKEESQEGILNELHVKATMEGFSVGAMLAHIRDNFKLTRNPL